MTVRSWTLAAVGVLLGLTTGCCRFCEHWCGHDYHSGPYYQPAPCCVPCNPCAPGTYTGYIAPQACAPPQPAPYQGGGFQPASGQR